MYAPRGIYRDGHMWWAAAGGAGISYRLPPVGEAPVPRGGVTRSGRNWRQKLL